MMQFVIDAALARVSTNDVFIYQGSRLAIYDPTSKKGPSTATTLRDFHPGLPKGWDSGIDAATFWPVVGSSGWDILFRGNQIAKMLSTGALEGVTGIGQFFNGLPKSFQEGIDAAVYIGSGSCLLFRGGYVARCNTTSRSVGQAAPIGQALKGLPAPFFLGIDAAFPEGRVLHLIKGGVAVDVDLKTLTAETGELLSLSKILPGWPAPLGTNKPAPPPAAADMRQLYAFCANVEYVPQPNDPAKTRWIVDFECLQRAWFNTTWATFADIPEVQSVLKRLGTARIDKIYDLLSFEEREQFFRVQMSYQLRGVVTGSEANVSTVEIVLDEGDPLRDVVETLTWFQLDLGTPTTMAEPWGAEVPGKAVQGIIAADPAANPPVTEQSLDTLATLSDSVQALLLYLYYPQSIITEPGANQFPELAPSGDDPGTLGPMPVPISSSPLWPPAQTLIELYRQQMLKRPSSGGGEPPAQKARLDDGGAGGAAYPAPPPPAPPPAAVPAAPPPPVSNVPTVPVAGSYQPFVGAFDIGQGNNVGIFGRAGTILAYHDYGYPLPFYVNTYFGHVAGGAPNPNAVPDVGDDPVMILSHWDYDHLGMSSRVPVSYGRRWMAPQQYMGAASARTLYANAAAYGWLYVWPAPGAGVLLSPWGYMERGTGAGPLLAGGLNETGLLVYVIVEENPVASWPAATWPAGLSAAPGPVGPLPGPVLAPPAVGALPAPGAMAPGPILLAPAGAAPPAGVGLYRFVLSTGDCSFPDIPSIVAGGVSIAGMLAPHHGSRTWMVPAPAIWIQANAYIGAMAAPAMGGGQPTPGLMTDYATMTAGPIGAPLPPPALPAAGFQTNVQNLLVPAPMAPAADPRVANGGVAPAPGAGVPATRTGANNVVGGGRVVYSFGINPATGNHAYTHPRQEAIVSFMMRGWTSRLDTTPNDASNLTSNQLYFPNWNGAAPGGVPPAIHRARPPGPVAPAIRAGGSALGWQTNGAGVMTFLWRDVLPGGATAGGAIIQRPRTGGVGPAYVFQY